MTNLFSIGRDPSCFGYVYCGYKCIAKSDGISEELREMVKLANAEYLRNKESPNG